MILFYVLLVLSFRIGLVLNIKITYVDFSHYIQMSMVLKHLGDFRDEFTNNEIYEIDAGATVRATDTGGASRNTLSSYLED